MVGCAEGINITNDINFVTTFELAAGNRDNKQYNIVFPVI
jgi:hypothetical protein